MDTDLQPVTINHLNPFPLDKSIQSLPQKFRDEFASSYDLVKGYTRNLKQYQDVEEHVRNTINETIKTINSITALLSEYQENSEKIGAQAEQADRLYKQFLSLETLQYQLISTNYNPELLKNKFNKVVEKSDKESAEILSSYKHNGGDMSSFLQRFKDSRKVYHSRREKLNRWNEERVSGFF